MSTIAFGAGSEQVGELVLPGGDGPHPVVVLWHGGGFAAQYTREMLAPAAADLAARGVAAWNVTYRRLGSDGGWPASFEDARLALAHLASLEAPLDLGEVSCLGFSAGFPLAFHASRYPSAVRPRRLVNLAGVSALEAAIRGSGPDADMRAAFGDPDDCGAAFAGGDPGRGLPLGLPSLSVHGDADAHVPVAMSEAFVAAARTAGDPAELLVLPGEGHFDVHLPGRPAWAAIAAWLTQDS